MKKMQFLLVEPVSKTPYPPLGLMKISSMLKYHQQGCEVFHTLGNNVPQGVYEPKTIYITSLFTWDVDKVVESILYYKRKFPQSRIRVGGVAASLIPNYIHAKTGVKSHIGLLKTAEPFAPDYSMNFGRKMNSSISFTSRGCVRSCKFCNVKTLEPDFFAKNNWERDIDENLPAITFWDNNWLASPNIEEDCEKLNRIGKRVDFNQGLDARLFDNDRATLLSKINLDPVRFAFDSIIYEESVINAIRLAKKHFTSEIRVYVLYNFTDTPEDFFHRIDLLNREGVLSFPMEYREASPSQTKFPGKHWNTQILRALKLSLMFYYRRGMITKSRNSFMSFFGRTPKQFIDKLYEVYRYDKDCRKKSVI
ncbi:MAG: hypothetical protein H7843_02975 [Nitrospirota bacterium]